RAGSVKAPAVKVSVVGPEVVLGRIRSLPELGLMNIPPVPDCNVATDPSGPSIVSEEPAGDWIVILPAPIFWMVSLAPRTRTGVVVVMSAEESRVASFLSQSF